MLYPGVAGGVEDTGESGLEERAREVYGMVAKDSDGAENLRGAAPTVFPSLVGLVALGVVALEPEVMLFYQFLPALGFLEEVVRKPAL